MTSKQQAEIAYVSSRLFLAVLALGLASVMVLGLTGRTGLAIVAGCVTGFLFIARQFVELMLMRRYLRNRPRKTSA